MNKIFLYSNQPIVDFNGRYYSKLKNFIDFLSLLSNKNSDYNIMLPCEDIDGSAFNLENINEILIPNTFIKMRIYDGHFSVFLTLMIILLYKNIQREIRL